MSHQVETPTVPTFAVVFGNTDTRLATDMPWLTHTAWIPCPSAVAPSQRHVHFRACLLACAQLPRGNMLPYFPRRALCRKTTHLLSLSTLVQPREPVHQTLLRLFTSLPMLPPGSGMSLPHQTLGPDRSHPIANSVHLTSAFPVPCHILRVSPACQKLRDSLLPLLVLVTVPPLLGSGAGCFGTCQAYI